MGKSNGREFGSWTWICSKFCSHDLCRNSMIFSLLKEAINDGNIPTLNGWRKWMFFSFLWMLWHARWKPLKSTYSLVSSKEKKKKSSFLLLPHPQYPSEKEMFVQWELIVDGIDFILTLKVLRLLYSPCYFLREHHSQIGPLPPRLRMLSWRIKNQVCKIVHC